MLVRCMEPTERLSFALGFRLCCNCYNNSNSPQIDVGHLGINKTVDAVREAMKREKVEVPTGLRSEITELINESMVCLKAREKMEKPKLFPHALHGGRFFERIQMDFLEGLPKGVEGYSSVPI